MTTLRSSEALKNIRKKYVNKKWKKKEQRENQKFVWTKRITKPFNDYKIFLHLYPMEPNWQTDRQNIYRIDAHWLDES